MLYLGIDQHKRQLTVNLRNEDETVILKRQVSTQWEKVRAFFADLAEKAGSEGGICYHVLNRGNAREKVFHKKEDYAAFLDLVEEAGERLASGTECLACKPRGPRGRLAVVFGGGVCRREACGLAASRSDSPQRGLARLG